MAKHLISVSNTGIQLAASGVSAGAMIPYGSAGDVPRLIRIASTVAACVRIGYGSQTALVTDLMVTPGESIVCTTAGASHIAVIAQSTAGVVQVSPLENLS
jgi:hypothetical protein